MRVHFSLNLTLDGCYDHRAIAGDAELHAHTARSMARADALLFGRVTYQLMEDAWRQPPGAPVPEDPFVRIIDPARKHVVSDTLDAVDWNAELVRGADLAATVARLREAPGDRVFVGGVRLAQALTEQRLIDSYELLVHPHVAGHGPYLFGGLTQPLDLRLVDRAELTSGAVVLHYER
ncbi:dihydrofolate reductase family protein [Nocardioides sp. LML1-1-1.1]|uniref:dihydrofolate reductase family protein n=1 Tax=Nocardioides sp. LML1-1-1.1 TaxID=3135248 RepID=UPI00342704A2